jgi:predicted transcriptional regulator
MQDDRRPDGPGGYERFQRSLMALIIDSWPVTRTRRELARVTGQDLARVKAALEALEALGLVEVHGQSGETVRPTVAARACHRMEAW